MQRPKPKRPPYHLSTMSRTDLKPSPPHRLIIFAALLSVSLVNTGYNVLTKQVLSAHYAKDAGDDTSSGSGSGKNTIPPQVQA